MLCGTTSQQLNIDLRVTDRWGRKNLIGERKGSPLKEKKVVSEDGQQTRKPIQKRVKVKGRWKEYATRERRQERHEDSKTEQKGRGGGVRGMDEERGVRGRVEGEV